MSRHRETSNVKPDEASYQWWYVWDPSIKYDSAITKFNRLEETKVIDDIYEEYGDGIWPFKPVTILTNRIKREKARVVYDQPHDPCPTDDNARFAGTMYSLSIEPSEEPDSKLPEIPGTAYYRLYKRYENALPSFSRDIPDMTVFVSEFADILSIFRFTTRSIGHFLANEHLKLQFAILPTLSEMKDIRDNLMNFKRRIQTVLAGLDKVHTFRTSLSVTEPSSVIQTQKCPWHGVICPTFVRRKATGHQWKLSLTIKYRYKLNFDIESLEGSIASIAASLGFLPDIKTVWEKIPLSFVVDWFFNTERILSKIKIGEDSLLDVEIVDCCIARKQRVYFSQVYMGACHASPMQYVLERSLYEREVGISAVVRNLPWFKVPNLKQIVTGVALARSRS